MKSKLAKIASTVCPFCLALGLIFTSIRSLIFWGEPDYPNKHDI